MLFLGANQDAFSTGASLNLRAGNVRNFVADVDGVANAMDVAASAVAEHRTLRPHERAAWKDTLFDRAEFDRAELDRTGRDRPGSPEHG